MSDEKVVLLRQVLRGRISLDALDRSGIRVQQSETGLAIDAPEGLEVELSTEDAAEAVLELRSRFQDLSRWAQFVLGSSTIVRLDDRFESSPDGAALLEGIWDAAVGSRPSGRCLEAAERIHRQGA